MGNKEPTPNANQIVHPRLGSIRLTQSKQGQNQITLMQKVYSINNERQIQEWLQGVSKIKNSQTTDVLFLPIKHRYEKAGMCGTGGSIFLTFEDFIFVLDNEIRNRQKNDKPFLETEIWYLLYNMIRAAKEFQKIDSKVGDIRPANIVINEDGQIKLISTRTRPGELDNFNKAVESREEQVYLAPEECNENYIKTAQYPSSISRPAAEIFTIGVTLLESATLIDCDRLYQRTPGYTFLSDTLEQIKMELRGKYSQQLVNYIWKMTDLNPSKRPKASKIFNQLQAYESQILNLQEFQFHVPQQHIQQQQPGYTRYSNYSPPSHPQYSQAPQQHNYVQNMHPSSYQETGYRPQSNYQIRPDEHIYHDMGYAPVQNKVPPISSTTYQSRPY